MTRKRNNKYLFFDIPKQERDSAIAFLLDALIKSRNACRAASNETEFDEDVNIYLAHLLFAASLPDYQKAVKRYVNTNVSEIAQMIEKNDDRIIRYFIYKINADYLTVHLGVFQDLVHLHGSLSKTEDQYSGMARNYYDQAALYNNRIYRRRTAIGAVLEKMSRRFHIYRNILRQARSDFFRFSNHFQDAPFSRFCEDVNEYEHRMGLERTRDRFLDSYLRWKQTGDPNDRMELIHLARELEKIDPDFSFILEA